LEGFEYQLHPCILFHLAYLEFTNDIALGWPRCSNIVEGILCHLDGPERTQPKSSALGWKRKLTAILGTGVLLILTVVFVNSWNSRLTEPPWDCRRLFDEKWSDRWRAVQAEANTALRVAGSSYGYEEGRLAGSAGL